MSNGQPYLYALGGDRGSVVSLKFNLSRVMEGVCTTPESEIALPTFFILNSAGGGGLYD